MSEPPRVIGPRCTKDYRTLKPHTPSRLSDYLSNHLARPQSNIIGPNYILNYRTNILDFLLTADRYYVTLYMVMEQHTTLIIGAYNGRPNLSTRHDIGPCSWQLQRHHRSYRTGLFRRFRVVLLFGPSASWATRSLRQTIPITDLFLIQKRLFYRSLR